jgi:hypothetical protein
MINLTSVEDNRLVININAVTNSAKELFVKWAALKEREAVEREDYESAAKYRDIFSQPTVTVTRVALNNEIEDFEIV